MNIVIELKSVILKAKFNCNRHVTDIEIEMTTRRKLHHYTIIYVLFDFITCIEHDTKPCPYSLVALDSFVRIKSDHDVMSCHDDFNLVLRKISSMSGCAKTARDSDLSS